MSLKIAQMGAEAAGLLSTTAVEHRKEKALNKDKLQRVGSEGGHKYVSRRNRNRRRSGEFSNATSSKNN